MLDIFPSLISKALSIPEPQVKATLDLLESGCTIPFISRYRKEATGSLDEVQIAAIYDQYEKLGELQKRKVTILSTIEEQGKLTDALHQRIDNCWNSTELEDIYLPYKPKRRTRAMVAREKGLEPLAQFLLSQAGDLKQRPATPGDVEFECAQYVNAEKGVANADEALKGAQDIIAEMVAEDEQSRNTVRRNFQFDAVITSKRVKSTKALSEAEELAAQKFRDYFDWSEPLKRCASHRLLAMRRGEAEGVLRLSIAGNEGLCIDRLCRQYVKSSRSAASPLVADAIADSFKRLLGPGIETEFMQSAKEKADQEAILIFVRNLEQLLMSAPLGQKRVLALDPGFRTGCKLVILDREGNLLHHDVIYPHPPKSQFIDAMNKVEDLIKKYKIEAISIGNGTASRETEEFVKGLDLQGAQVFVVSEDGASIYSASKVAREEFPDEDVTVRGAVSIGRRLMDPLAELVKIDPNSIGVGQYQKDVDQKELKKSLDQTVENCVNKVGVNVNTASKHLLTYISGLGPLLAQNIVDYRAKHGAFHNRRELMDVPRMGPKAFEQSAGFLRIAGGDNPLDNSAVHPERYAIVEKMASDLGCHVNDLIGPEGKALREKIDLKRYVTAVADDSGVGLPTLEDILKELDKPGRDPRQQLEEFSFSNEVKTLEDVQVGMVLPGIVTNITNFGAFVDIGVHTQGLVHVSELADKYVKDPNTVVSLHQHVKVRVKDVDLRRGRLSLSMKNLD
ncbi:MAG: RNA-binding transcriptional accessory protein [Bacteroidales bacterium]|nr:RNA-binding transcriptional accessory protein [Bacteroidales bacterium]